MPAPTVTRPVTGTAPNKGISIEADKAAIDGALAENYGNIEAHKAATDNPHSVTKAQLGLGSVDNTADVDKPVSTATQAALDAKAALSALTTETAGRILSDVIVGYARPGEMPEAYRSEITGAASAGTPYSGSNVVVDDELGACIELVDVATHVAARQPTPTEPGRVYLLRVAVKRESDPADPLGDAVEYGVRFLQPALTGVAGGSGNRVISIDDPLVAADGWQYFDATFSIDVEGVDYTIPAGAAFGAPWVRTYGTDHQTRIARVELTDISSAWVGLRAEDASATAVAAAVVATTKAGEATDASVQTGLDVSTSTSRALDAQAVATGSPGADRPWLLSSEVTGSAASLTGFSDDDVVADAVLGSAIQLTGGENLYASDRARIDLVPGRVFQATWDFRRATDLSGAGSINLRVRTWEADGTTQVDMISYSDNSFSVADGRQTIGQTFSLDVAGVDHLLDPAASARAYIYAYDAAGTGVVLIGSIQFRDVTESWLAQQAAASAGVWGGYVYPNLAAFTAVASSLSASITRVACKAPDGSTIAFARLALATEFAALPGWIADGVRTPWHHGALGDDSANDRPAFAEMNAAGGRAYIPVPPTAWNLSAPIALDAVDAIFDATASWETLTGGGSITWGGGRVTQAEEQSPIPGYPYRMPDRLFVGFQAAAQYAADTMVGNDGGSAWFGDSANGASYLPRDARAVFSGDGLVGAAFVSRTSDRTTDQRPTIGAGSYVVNDGYDGDPTAAWAWIAELDLQRAGGTIYGMEIGAKDTSTASRNPSTPYVTRGGVFGIWGAGGGDASFGDPALKPADSLIHCLRNNLSGLGVGGWESALTVRADAIFGTDGSAASTTTGDAIKLARMHRIAWFEPGTETVGFSFHSSVKTAAEAWYLTAGAQSLTGRRTSDNKILWQMRDSGAGAVDYPALQNGNGLATLYAEGDSANVDMRILPKGSGVLRHGVGVAASNPAAFSADGYIAEKLANGTLVYKPYSVSPW
ncbi:hypothetical protein [Pararhodobacter zhoushanensis]|uniref:hypothetical protein n=1 Tax=Pararhodobacter zhoushanensis TaxID=2479545 RepID=UPI000F8ED0F5|nr:hypothetical protein [Pararhodobacter zhoushanensis]